MSCPHTPRVQAYLDGDLAPPDAARFRDHLSSCETCALEVSLYRRVMDSIARAAQFEPGRDLAERILDDVLPARVRRRWLRRFATGYAAALLATLTLALTVGQQPAVRETAIVLAGSAARGLVQTLAVALHGAGIVFSVLGSGWGLIELLGARVAPFTRAFAALFRDTGIALPVAVAAIASALVLWWMRGRDARAGRDAPWIGIVGPWR